MRVFDKHVAIADAVLLIRPLLFPKEGGEKERGMDDKTGCKLVALWMDVT